MEYRIYKLTFPSGVHFGNGNLNDSEDAFGADVLFSALYIEALKMKLADTFFDSVKNSNIIFSDAFPYVGERYLLPKPRIHIEVEKNGDSIQKKQIKKLKYIDIEKIESFFEGSYDFEDDPYKNLGMFKQQIMASVRREEPETLPYYVGTYYYKEKMVFM